MSKRSFFKSFTVVCALSLGLQSCFPFDVLFPPDSELSGEGSGVIFDDLFDLPTEGILEEIPYAEGELVGQEENYNTLSDDLGLTSAALLQAILAINSVLYTDPENTSLETFAFRHSEAQRALDILAQHADDTITQIDKMESESESGGFLIGQDASSLTPEQVLVTVADGPANRQLRTLMETYHVNARQAKEILDNAMAGLQSKYNKQAEFYDAGMRTANLIQKGANLSLTLAGGVYAAGGIAGTLTIGKAATLLISSTDGIVKVTKAGMELILGKDLKIKDQTASTLVSGLSDVAELISIKDMFKPDNWFQQDKLIKFLYKIRLKEIELIENGEITLGSRTFRVRDRVKAPPIPETEPPTTLPGTYRVNGKKKTVKELTGDVKRIIEHLPKSEQVDIEKISQETPQIITAPTPLPSDTPIAVPTLAPTSAPSVPPGSGSTSDTMEWAWSHMSYSITGVDLEPFTFVGGTGYFIDTRNYKGRIVGNTITLSGSGSSDNESPDNDNPYALIASLTVGSETKNFEYRAPQGEKLNQSFSLTLPVPEGVTNFNFTVKVLYLNQYYGTRGIVVNGGS